MLNIHKEELSEVGELRRDGASELIRIEEPAQGE